VHLLSPPHIRGGCALVRPPHTHGAPRSGAARALYVFDYSDFAADWAAELASPHLGRCAKPLARLFAKLNPDNAHVAAPPDAAPLALKLLTGALACACAALVRVPF
jgi:hypothetical protein